MFFFFLNEIYLRCSTLLIMSDDSVVMTIQTENRKRTSSNYDFFLLVFFIRFVS